MNERFLNRGKSTVSGEGVLGYYCPTAFAYFPCKPSIYPAETINSHWHAVEIIPETVGGCTGLTDKNGKTVFEGDLLKAGDFIFVVKFGKCGGVPNVDHEVGYMGFYVIPVGKDAETLIDSGLRTDILYWLNACDVYVIGNIHDNKQMLECADMPVSNDVFQPVLQSTTPENFEIAPA